MCDSMASLVSTVFHSYVCFVCDLEVPYTGAAEVLIKCGYRVLDGFCS